MSDVRIIVLPEIRISKALVKIILYIPFYLYPEFLHEINTLMQGIRSILYILLNA